MNDEWQTPGWLYDRLNAHYKFDLDMAANEDNSRCDKYCINAFKEKSQIVLYQAVWCNPPYSRGNIDRFMCLISDLAPAIPRIVSLVNVDTSTVWFRSAKRSSHCQAVAFINRRLQFRGADNSHMYPSMLLIFGSHRFTAEEFTMLDQFAEVWSLK